MGSIDRRELPPSSFGSFSDKVLPLCTSAVFIVLVVCIDRVPFSWTGSVANLVGRWWMNSFFPLLLLCDRCC